MALNPSIIMAGQAPDVIGSMARGQEAGMQAVRGQRENALAGLYQTQGAGILAGDQSALNALAGISPEAAFGAQNSLLGQQQTRLGMDQTRQNMAFDREKMQMIRQEAAEAAKAQAAAMSAAERAEAAQKIEAGLRGAIPYFQSGDRAGFAAYVQSQGLDPAQFTMEAFPSAIAQYTGVLDTLKTFNDVMTPQVKPPADEYGRYVAEEQAAGRQPMDRIAFAQALKGKGFEVTLPDGTRVAQGGPNAKPFTEGQSKDNVFATRAEGALATLDPVAGELTSVGQRALEYDPTGLVRGALQSDNFQIATQSGREFLQAILRKDTGAAITPAEEGLYGKTYLPQPGDNPAVQEAKAASRIRAVEALKSGMNAQQLEATARADAAIIERLKNEPNAAPQAPVAPAQPIVIDGFMIEEVQ